MPSRQVGSLAIAAALALFAVILFYARDEHGTWRTDRLGFGSLAKRSSRAANTVRESDRDEKSQAKPQRRQQATTALSKEVKDPATGLALPRTKRFSKSELTCLGVGVRAKSIAVAKVNVYTVGLYVDTKAARGALKKFAGADPGKLVKDPSLFKALGQVGFTKYLHLVFARSVGAQKVVDALTSVKGVGEDTLFRFSKIILDAVGGTIGKGESISLGWEGKDKMVVLVRDKAAGTVVDAALPKAVFDLYLGADPVAPAAKGAIAEGVPAFLAQ